MLAVEVQAGSDDGDAKRGHDTLTDYSTHVSEGSTAAGHRPLLCSLLALPALHNAADLPAISAAFEPDDGLLGCLQPATLRLSLTGILCCDELRQGSDSKQMLLQIRTTAMHSLQLNMHTFPPIFAVPGCTLRRGTLVTSPVPDQKTCPSHVGMDSEHVQGSEEKYTWGHKLQLTVSLRLKL